MRLAFMGTPEFAVPALGELFAAGHEIACVYTKAPQPAGRGHKLRKSPIHQFADSHGIDVRTPKSFKKENEREAFASLGLDAAVVVAYGLILPQVILDAPQYGCFNLHASLLPRWRGAAPIHRAIMAGDEETGVQVMRMEAGLDTGSILLSEKTPINPDDTTASLHDRLALIGASLLPRALSALERGGLTETPQGESGVTYAEKISPNEARINWRNTAKEVDCHIRGLSPYPGAWFEVLQNEKRRRVKVLMSSVMEGDGAPGEILLTDGALIVACETGAVSISRLQREGKAAQNSDEFLHGHSLAPGDIVV